MYQDSASDDVPSSDRVRSLLKDLREARQSKTHQGLEALDAVHVEVRCLLMRLVCTILTLCNR